MHRMDTDNVKTLTVRELSIEQVKKALPLHYNQQLLLSDACIGKQPPHTCIIAAVKKTLSSRVRDDVPEKRLTLREVLQNGVQSELNLDLFVYGNLVGAVDKFLGETKDTKDMLLVLSETRLIPYTGYPQKGWCKLGLQAGNKRAPNSQVWLVKSGAVVEEQMDVDCDDDVLICHKKSPYSVLPQDQNKFSGSAPPSHPQSWDCKLLRHPKSPSKTQMCDQKSLGTSLPQHKNYHDVLSHVRKSPGFHIPQNEKSPVVESSTSHAIPNGHGCFPDSEVFVPINACEPGTEVTVCGVVRKGVAEFEGDVGWGNGAVVDPSCLKEGAEYRELLVTGQHNFTTGIIVLLKNIQVEYHGFDLHARVKAPRQAVTFSSSLSDPIVPDGDDSDFVLTDTVRDKVREMRNWWREVTSDSILSLSVPPSSTFSQAVPANQAQTSGTPISQTIPQHPICTISTIEKETIFTMYCQVVELRLVSGELMAVMRVQDGTVSKGMFLQYNLEEMTQELMTQTETYSDIGSTCVDILIISPTEDLQSVKEGTIVCLHGVRCNAGNAMLGDETELTLFELCLDASTASVTSLSLDHPAASSILRLLHKDETSESKHGKVCAAVKSASSEKEARVEAVTKSCVVPVASSSSIKVPPPATTSPKEQLVMCKNVREESNGGGGGEENLSHQHPVPGSITTVLSGEFSTRTLKQFSEEGEPGEMYKVEAVLAELLSFSSNKCNLCTDVAVCQHTWIWGMCLVCGRTYSGQELFQSFPCSVLRMATTLSCISCSESHQTTGSPVCETSWEPPGAAPSVVPFLRLMMLLTDPCNTHHQSQFHLTADNAERFFGVKPSFQWLECGGREDVKELLRALYSQSGPHTFGVVKTCMSNGAIQLDITNTSLSLAR